MSHTTSETNVKPETLNAFDAMWGLHPSPVMLIRVNREIVGVNEAGTKLGITAGLKCFQLTGSANICEGCQGNAALKSDQARRSAAWSDKLNMFADTYWIPVRGEDGLFVHFGNNITEWVKEDLCG